MSKKASRSFFERVFLGYFKFKDINIYGNWKFLLILKDYEGLTWFQQTESWLHRKDDESSKNNKHCIHSILTRGPFGTEGVRHFDSTILEKMGPADSFIYNYLKLDASKKSMLLKNRLNWALKVF